MKNKTVIRKEMRELRAVRYFESPAFLKNFRSHFSLSNTDVVALYYPCNHEVDSLPFAQYALDSGASLALPAISNDSMNFYLWDMQDDLIVGKYGIKEPTTEEKASPTIILVPLLAFDRAGYRVGYGKGYYDKAIAEFDQKARPITVGLAFSFQEVEKIPHDAHDQKMDFIVTEKELIRI